MFLVLVQILCTTSIESKLPQKMIYVTKQRVHFIVSKVITFLHAMLRSNLFHMSVTLLQS